MMLRTHLAFSFLLSLIITNNFELTNPFLFVVIAALSSTIPDIDHLKSFIGKRLEFMSIALNFFFKHRGILHNLFLIFIICFFIYLKNKEISAAILIGYGSHLFLDALTKKGIKPFYPLKMRIKGFFKTNSLFENVLFLIFIAAIIHQLL